MTGLAQHWQERGALSVLLYPLSLIFRTIVALRHTLYACGLRKPSRLRAPVIIAGNITAGGTGKTPLVLWLVSFLQQQGYSPGIVSRGHGGCRPAPHAIAPDADPALHGDEPVLLAQRSGCPVWTGRNRAAAARSLLAACPDCNVIVSDDGLQHHALGRDLELAVIDGSRGLGNGWMLPAGPLREPATKLDKVDAVIINGDLEHPLSCHAPVFRMDLHGQEFVNVLNPLHCANPDQFQARPLRAIAGIGNPQRFFAHLQLLGLSFTAHAFADHHPYRSQDLDFAAADTVLMTEKDAVKCAAFARETWWALRVDAVIDPALGALVLDHLRMQ